MPGFNPASIGAPSPVGRGGGVSPGDVRFFLADPGAGWVLCDGTVLAVLPPALRNGPFDGRNAIDAASVFPAMTSNAAPSGYTATCSSSYSAGGSFDAYSAFDKSIDDGWCSSSNTTSEFVALQVPTAFFLGAVAVTAVSNSVTDMPRNFGIEGYSGSSWNRLMTVSSLASWTASERRVFNLPSVPATAYNRYRLLAESGSNGNYVRIGQLEFLRAQVGLSLPNIPAAAASGARAYMRIA